MYTEIDEGFGLVKTSWQNIRERVKKVDPIFTKLVDNLDTDKTFPIYLAYLPYGDLKGDTQSTLLPKLNGGYFRISEPNTPKEILKYLGYSINGSPFGMVLEKELEYYIDFKSDNISMPWAVYKPGHFFSFDSYLSKNNSRTYAPNSIITVTSGARSTFMLPNIGCAIYHSNLQREFNISSGPPKNLYDHWYIFKEIINSNVIKSNWRACLLYFSEKWLIKLHTDKNWLSLKLYLHEQAWNYFQYQRCRHYYDTAFSTIQKNRNLKPNPYLSDTAKHLFAVALGDAPGYVPACDEDSLPLKIIQKAFVEIYGLKKYLPTIIKPGTFYFENDSFPIYYSLQHPSTYNFAPKSRKESNTLLEMRELHHVMNVFINELKGDLVMGSDSVIGDVAKKIDFSYFHNKVDRHKVIRSSVDLLEKDKRFSSILHFFKHPGATLAVDAPFVRGCVSIATKN